MKSLRCLVPLALFASTLAAAQEIESIQVSSPSADTGYTFSIPISLFGPLEDTCGLQLDFGDGVTDTQQVKVGTPATFSHQYQKAGTFSVVARGKTMGDIMRRVPPCGGQQSQLITILDPKMIEDGSLDVLFFARTRDTRMGTPPAFTDSGASAQLVVPHRSVCINTVLLRDAPRPVQTHYELLAGLTPNRTATPRVGELYRQAKIDNIQAVAHEHADQALLKMGYKGPTPQRCNSEEEISAADIIAVPRLTLAEVMKSRRLAALSHFAPLHTLPFGDALKTAEPLKQKQDAALTARTQARSELARLASAKSTDSVGSLLLRLERDNGKRQRVCTVVQKGDAGAAILGYRALGAGMLLPDTQALYTREGLSLAPLPSRPFDSVFADVNDALRALYQSPRLCQVFVDFPANLHTLQEALKKDRWALAQPGQVIDAHTLRKGFAKRLGYDDYNDAKLAAALKLSADDIKQLREAGLRNESDYANVLTLLPGDKKSPRGPKDVAEYLKKNGPPGAPLRVIVTAVPDNAPTPVPVTEDTPPKAPNFPFEAELKCGIDGKYTALQHCLADTDPANEGGLELRNGTTQTRYPAQNISAAGTEQTDNRLTIALQDSFDIRAQNAHQVLTLTLTIRDAASGKEILTQQAAYQGTISASR